MTAKGFHLQPSKMWVNKPTGNGDFIDTQIKK